MYSTKAYFTSNGQLLLSGDLDSVVFGEDASSRKSNPTLGPKTMLALRVIASDVSTTSTADKISDAWFGTSGERVNLKSQYYACSNGKLHCNPANQGSGTSRGVYTATINDRVNGTESGTIRKAAIAAAEAELGTLNPQFDHVMVCIPPGTSGNWIAYAYVNHWQSVYNNRWCDFVSAQMHEIGHNFNLAHSGETSAYDDQSGMVRGL